MPLGELLLSRNVITQAQLERVLQEQKIAGGRFGDNMVALGYVSRESLESILQEPPPVPKTLQETGLESNFILNLLLRLMYITGLQTIPELSEQLKLTRSVVEGLLTFAKNEALVEIRGPAENNYTIMRYALTNAGKSRASEALRRCEYIGPAPVTLASYQMQVQKQTITNEIVSEERLKKSLAHLILPSDLIRKIGPAANSGRAILLYGGAGNGKTSIAEAIATSFQQSIYIPYCIEADGQIIKLYDPAVHATATTPATANNGAHPMLLPPMEHDPRWVRCRRPYIISGGELTLEMLDLDFDPHSKYYEAPLQMKAIGGVFIIDDFGRQRVRPQDLLNRWIFPLERKVDYLTLHTGKKFELLFDQLVIFATNFPPEELMDPAQLRRIHNKLHVNPPTMEDFSEIFRRICDASGLEFSDETLAFLLNSFYLKYKVPFAGFHPKFIVEHAIAVCHYKAIPPRLSRQVLADALDNMVILPTPGRREPNAVP